MGRKSREKNVFKELKNIANGGTVSSDLNEYTLGTINEKGDFTSLYGFDVPKDTTEDPLVRADAGEHLMFVRDNIIKHREDLYVQQKGSMNAIPYIALVSSLNYSQEIKLLYYAYRIIREGWIARKRRKVMERIHEYAGRYLKNQETKPHEKREG